MWWQQHLLTADGCVPIHQICTEQRLALLEPSRPEATPSCGSAVPLPPVPLELRVSPAHASPASHVDHIWRALKGGTIPGSDPDATESGRFTLEACLCEWVAKMDTEAKYALLHTAVSAEPPQMTGLAAVLKLKDELQWVVELNAHIHTSRGLFSLAGLALINNPGSDDTMVPVLRMLKNCGLDLTTPAVLTPEGEPCETLAHLVVTHNLGVGVLHLLSECGDVMDSRRKVSGTAVGGPTPLWDACSLGQLQQVRFLHESCGAALCTSAAWGQVMAPIHVASSEGHVEVVRYLLERGVPVDFATPAPQGHCTETGGWVRAAPKTECDETPLQLACRNGHLELVRLLHAHGADLGVNIWYRAVTPFSLAFRGGHTDVVSYLRSYGVREHTGSGNTKTGKHAFEEGVSLPEPPKQQAKRQQRSTPMRTRAERANVLDRYKDTPPGLRDRIQDGSASAKKELRAIHKHNHQVVDRAEVATHPDKARHAKRKSADAKQKRNSRHDAALERSCHRLMEEFDTVSD